MKQIHWYPGHMAKTKKEIIEKVKLVDVVLELVDARLPFSSQNPIVDKMIGNTPKIILFNKSDLADPSELDKWVSYFQNKNVPSLKINAANGKGIQQILPLMKVLLVDKIAKEKSRGRTERPLRAMILGIPNVGKSTLINAISGRTILTQPISKSLGRGKHTTRHSELMEVEGGLVADTAGFSSLDFLNMDEVNLAQSFHDFFELSDDCKYRGCLHISEPGCKVKEIVG